MALPVNLNNGWLAATGISSVNGITTFHPDMQFAQVQQVGGLEGYAEIGQYVFFNIKDTIQVVYSEVQYFLVKADNVIFTEILPL